MLEAMCFQQRRQRTACGMIKPALSLSGATAFISWLQFEQEQAGIPCLESEVWYFGLFSSAAA